MSGRYRRSNQHSVSTQVTPGTVTIQGPGRGTRSDAFGMLPVTECHAELVSHKVRWRPQLCILTGQFPSDFNEGTRGLGAFSKEDGGAQVRGTMQGLETDPLALGAQRAVRTDCPQGQEWLLWETESGKPIRKSSLGSHSPSRKHFPKLDQKFKYICKKETITFPEKHIKCFIILE